MVGWGTGAQAAVPRMAKDFVAKLEMPWRGCGHALDRMSDALQCAATNTSCRSCGHCGGVQLFT